MILKNSKRESPPDEAHKKKTREVIEADLNNGQKSFRYFCGAAFKITRDYEKSRDIVVEAYTKAIESSNCRIGDCSTPLRHNEPLRTYIHVSVIHGCYKRKKSREYNYDTETFSYFQSELVQRKLWEENPLLKLVENEEEEIREMERGNIRDAVSRLPERLRLLIEIRYFREIKSYLEIAKETGIKTGTVNNRLQTARKELKRIMEMI